MNGRDYRGTQRIMVTLQATVHIMAKAATIQLLTRVIGVLESTGPFGVGMWAFGYVLAASDSKTLPSAFESGSDSCR